MDIDKLQKIHELHILIKKERTGTVLDLCKVFNKSKNTIYLWMDSLKTIGAEIEWSRTDRTFYYINNFEFEFKVKYTK